MHRSICLALLLVGCGANTDPCAGKSGACIGLHVVGPESTLDQLAFTLGNARTAVQRTPNPAESFTLPIKVALFPPAGTTGTVHVSADGLKAGRIIAHGEVDAPLVNGHAVETLTLAALAGDMSAGPNADLAGADLGGTSDLSACATVTACMDGDGCCPADCNNSNDKDCPSVCGNKIVETGEVCDDGNTLNGDGCDPTCQWSGIMTTLSGAPGACGYADGAAPRFGSFGGIASDGTNFWITDRTSATLRQFVPSYDAFTPQMSTTLFGAAYDSRLVDGAFTDARIHGDQTNLPLVYVSGNKKLYFVDDNTTAANVLREVDLVNQTVTSIATTVVMNNPVALSTDGTTIFYLGKNGDVDKWTPGAGASTQIYKGATGGSCNSIVRSQGTTYLGCSGAIVNITDAGVETTYAGTLNSAGTCVDNANKAMATFEGILSIQADSSGNLYEIDCNAIREVTTGVTTLAGQLGMSGFADGTNATSLFGFGLLPLILPFTPGSSQAIIGDSANCVVRSQDVNGVSTIAGAAPGTHATDVRGSGSASRYNQITAPQFYFGVVSDGVNLYALGRPAGSIFSSSLQELIGINLMSGTSTDLHTFGAVATSITRIGSTLYVSLADGTIHRIGTDGMNDAVMAGMGGNATYPPSDGTAGNPLSAVMNPIALSTDGTDVYFLDAAKLVRKITLATSTLSLVAGTQDSTDVADGSGGSVHFANPTALAYAKGSLYTMDGPNLHRQVVVRRIDLSARTVKTIVGQLNNMGDADGVGLAGQISGAWFLASDGNSLFISDVVEPTLMSPQLSPSIRQLDLESLSLTTMIGQRGQWTLANGTGTKALVHAPGPITFDSATHALYFFDRYEGVFQKIR